MYVPGRSSEMSPRSLCSGLSRSLRGMGSDCRGSDCRGSSSITGSTGLSGEGGGGRGGVMVLQQLGLYYKPMYTHANTDSCNNIIAS